MKCINCGSQNEKEAKFCLKCGKPLGNINDPIICPDCGHKNKAGSVHCTECGKLLTEKGSNASEKDGVVRKKPRLKQIIIILILLFGLAGIAILASLLGIWDIHVIDMLPPKEFRQQNPAPSESESPFITETGQARIHWNCDGLKNKNTPMIPEITRIQVNMGWGASTPDQIQDFLDHAQYVVTVDGLPVSTKQYHDQIREQGDMFMVDQGAEIFPLEPGTHFVYLKITLDEKIFDGEDYYGPGTEVESFDGICTVNVQ